MRRTGGTYYTFAFIDGTELHGIYNTCEEAEAGAKEFTQKQIAMGHTEKTEKIIVKTNWHRVYDDTGLFLQDERSKITVGRVELND